MGEFNSANLVRRRQILEDALAEALQHLGPIMIDEWGDRCLGIKLPGPPDHLDEHRLFPLWTMACDIEARLE